MNRQTHRTCIRLRAGDYQKLQQRSAAAKLSMNAYLMQQLESNRPIGFR